MGLRQFRPQEIWRIDGWMDSTTWNNSFRDFSNSTRIVTDYMEMVGSELSHSFLNQTDNSSEKSLNEYETHDNEDDQSFKSLSNQCEPPEDDIIHEETSISSESEQTRIGAFEDEQYDNCIEEYLVAFYSDENTSHTNSEDPVPDPVPLVFCMEYQGLSMPDDKLCKNRCCLKDLSTKGRILLTSSLFHLCAS